MAEWFVRPSGGDYGAANGETFETAWDGFANVVQGASGVQAGDTLFICGLFQDEANIDFAENGTATNRITISGEHSRGAGIIDCSAGTVDRALKITGDYVTVAGVTVRNVVETLIGYGIEFDGAESPIMERCKASNCYWDGLRFDDCDNGIIRDCVAVGNLVRGISIETTTGTSTNCRIENCTTRGNGRRGFSLGGESDGTITLTNAAIIDCESIGDGEGAQVENGNDCFVENIIVTNAADIGLDHSGTPTGYGIQFRESTGSILGGTITNAESHGIFVRGSSSEETQVKINGVKIAECGDGATTYGIYVANDKVDEFVVAGCAIEDDNAGIYFQGTNGGQVYDRVHICNNTIIVGDGTLGFCIDIKEENTTGDVIVSNNVMQSVNDYALNIRNTGSSVTIENNHYHRTDGGNVALYNGSSYNAGNVSGLDSGATTGEFTVDDDLRILSGDALAATGSAWWSANARPRGPDGEPFVDIDASIGAYQARDIPFHPARI